MDGIDKLRQDVDCALSSLADRVAALETALNCTHQPFTLDGKTPFHIVAIADARKMDIVMPGQPPPLVFALSLCKHCWQVYPTVNKLAEAEPFKPAAPPVKLVRPGDVVE